MVRVDRARKRKVEGIYEKFAKEHLLISVLSNITMLFLVFHNLILFKGRSVLNFPVFKIFIIRIAQFIMQAGGKILENEKTKRTKTSVYHINCLHGVIERREMGQNEKYRFFQHLCLLYFVANTKKVDEFLFY